MIVCFLFFFFSLKYFAHGLIFFKTLVCSADAATLIEACDMLRGGGSSTAGANAAAPILTRSLLDPKHPEALETAEVVHMRMKEAHGVEVMVTRMEHVRRFSPSFSRCFSSLLFQVVNRDLESKLRNAQNALFHDYRHLDPTGKQFGCKSAFLGIKCDEVETICTSGLQQRLQRNGSVFLDVDFGCQGSFANANLRPGEERCIVIFSVVTGILGHKGQKQKAHSFLVNNQLQLFRANCCSPRVLVFLRATEPKHVHAQLAAVQAPNKELFKVANLRAVNGNVSLDLGAVPLTTTVAEVKKMIGLKIKHSPSRLVLLFTGAPAHDEETLDDLGVDLNGDVVSFSTLAGE